MSVTVFTFSYNKPKYVLDAINSVLTQVHKDLTYYIIENSTDNVTRKVIKDHLAKVNDNRVKYMEIDFIQELRDSIYVPAMLCDCIFPLADKKYVYYLSDDDVIHPECLSSMVRYLDECPQFGACYCRGSRDWLRGDKFIKEMEFHFASTFNGTSNPPIWLDCVIDAGQVLQRKSILEKMIAREKTLHLFDIRRHEATHHSDGLFLNKLAKYTTIQPCPYGEDKCLMTHRYTEVSTWTKN